MTRFEPTARDHGLSRREALARTSRVSLLAVMGRHAAAPLALATLTGKAAAQAPLPGSVVTSLNFLLQLEHATAELYARGLAAGGLIPGPDRAIYETLRGHENAHVELLRGLLGSRAAPRPSFGSGGSLQAAFTSYSAFIAAAQVIEDVGVRAYKGQIRPLMRYPDVLETVFTIHSVEARHASEVRRLRGGFGNRGANKGWITGTGTDIPGSEPIYAGEANANEAGISVRSITTVGLDRITESFDEPLSTSQLGAIVDQVIG